jgi:transcriptional regulator with XRE-family HTH domain
MTEQQIEKIPEWTLGWRIRRAMADAGISRDELAQELGYAPNSISNWMHDKTPVRAGVLKQIALRCSVNFEWLKDGVSPATRRKAGDSRGRAGAVAAAAA